jgi:hypothetical protein
VHKSSILDCIIEAAYNVQAYSPRENWTMCHVITEEHTIHFHSQHPDIEKGDDSDFDTLVSMTSVTISRCHTTAIYGTGQVCLMLVGYRNRSRMRDWRWSDGFMDDMVKALGITGEPNRYPCRYR